MSRLILASNLPADNRLPISFKATYDTKKRLIELGELLAECHGLAEPLNISAVIRTCIHFTYSRRKAIMMARLREQRKAAVQQCQQEPTSSVKISQEMSSRSQARQ